MEPQAERYLCMLRQIMNNGQIIKPRGIECKELEDLQIHIDPDCPFMAFDDRKYNIEYFKQEMRWKLRANKYDTSIQNHANMWEDVINPDGTYNSNYGQYWFGEQHGIWDVVTELLRDPNSRKAVIPMLNVSHMSPQTVDTVCTECVGFRIRNGCLNMSVHMRSSDVIYGLGTDIPTFAFLYRLVMGLIGGVLPGLITITAMSSHIYAKHYGMVNNIILKGSSGYKEIPMPYCNTPEALKIIAGRGNGPILRQSGALGEWLCQIY